jgi:hypothetical protein
MKCAVYRHIGSHGEILYIGASEQPEARQTAHRTSSHWWAKVARIETRWHGSKEAALSREAWEIFKHKPPFNRTNALSRVAALMQVTVRTQACGKLDRAQAFAPAGMSKTSARTQVSDWLKQNRYTQRAFAAIIGTDETHMSRILSDATKAKPGRILRKAIADKTGLPVADEGAWL